MPWPFCALEGTPVYMKKEARWAPEPVWTFLRREKHVSNGGIQTPDHTARNLVTLPIKLSRLRM